MQFVGRFTFFVAVFLGLMARPAFCGNILVNGSFEAPIVTSSDHCDAYANCLGFDLQNSNIAGWTVIGKGGAAGEPTILLLSNAYTEPDNSGNNQTLHFFAQSGNQSIDLTGAGNQGGCTPAQVGPCNGIKQTVATTAGQSYQLSFWLGNQWDQAPGYGLPSSLDLFINGNFAGVFTNDNNTPENVNWQNFTFDFTGTGSSTTIAFINATPYGDNYAGLDNVELVPQVPEPASMFLLGSGLLALVGARKARSSR